MSHLLALDLKSGSDTGGTVKEEQVLSERVEYEDGTNLIEASWWNGTTYGQKVKYFLEASLDRVMVI